MAKFKVGDRVRDTEAMRDGVIVEVDAEKPGYYAVKYDTRPQPQWNVPESYLTLANSRACNSTNPVVANAMRARNYSAGFEGEPEYKYYRNVLALREKAMSEVRKLEAVASSTATACKKFFDEWKAQKGKLTQEMNRTTELNADTQIVYPVEQSINLLKSSTK